MFIIVFKNRMISLKSKNIFVNYNLRLFSINRESINRIQLELNQLHKFSIERLNHKVDRSLYKLLLYKDIYYLVYNKWIKLFKKGNIQYLLDYNIQNNNILFDRFLNKIINNLQNESFQFKFRKKINFFKFKCKVDTIPVISILDKIVLESIKLLLSIVYEPFYTQNNCIFNLNINNHSILYTIFTKFNGCTWWIKSNFFDHKYIFYSKILCILEKKILDKRFIRLIIKIFNIKCFKYKKYNLNFLQNTKLFFLPLSNIYFYYFDIYIKDMKFQFGKRFNFKKIVKFLYYQIYYKLNRVKKNKFKFKLLNIKSNSLFNNEYSHNIYIFDNRYRKLKYIRFLDNWVLAINGSYIEALNIKNRIIYYFFNSMGLVKYKIKIINIMYMFINFLSINIKYSSIKNDLFLNFNHSIFNINPKALILNAPIKNIYNEFIKIGLFSFFKGTIHYKWYHFNFRDILYKAFYIIRLLDKYYSFIKNKFQLGFIYFLIKDTIMRTLAKKFSLKSKFQVYKKFRYKLKVISIENIFMNNSGIFKIILKSDQFNFKDEYLKLGVNFYNKYISDFIFLDYLICINCNFKIKIYYKNYIKYLKQINIRILRLNKKWIILCKKCQIIYYKLF